MCDEFFDFDAGPVVRVMCVEPLILDYVMNYGGVTILTSYPPPLMFKGSVALGRRAISRSEYIPIVRRKKSGAETPLLPTVKPSRLLLRS